MLISDTRIRTGLEKEANYSRIVEDTCQVKRRLAFRSLEAPDIHVCVTLNQNTNDFHIPALTRPVEGRVATDVLIVNTCPGFDKCTNDPRFVLLRSCYDIYINSRRHVHIPGRGPTCPSLFGTLWCFLNSLNFVWILLISAAPGCRIFP
jgi:hypothetical protein